MYTLLDAALAAKATRQIQACNDLAKSSGIIATAMAAAASNGSQDIDIKNLALGAGAFRIVNQGVDITQPEMGQVTTDLFPYSYEDKVDKQILRRAKMTAQQWVKHLEPSILEGSAQALSSQLVYGTGASANGFIGLRQIAFESGNNFATYGSGGEETYTSILCVHWHQRECTLLYDPADMRGLNKQALFQLFLKNGGNETTLYDTNSKPYTGYEFGAEILLGLKVMSTARVSVLTGVRNATNYIPTASDLRDLIEAVHGTSDGNTFFYVNSTSRKLIGGLMDTYVRFDPRINTPNIPLFVGSVDNIPVILEDGITQTELRAS